MMHSPQYHEALEEVLIIARKLAGRVDDALLCQGEADKTYVDKLLKAVHGK
jgi:hypothetical protein